MTEAEYEQASKRMDEALTPIEVELCDHADKHLDLRHCS